MQEEEAEISKRISGLVNLEKLGKCISNTMNSTFIKNNEITYGDMLGRAANAYCLLMEFAGGNGKREELLNFLKEKKLIILSKLMSDWVLDSLEDPKEHLD